MRTKIRFSLAALLVVASIVSGYFAGLDRGYQAGLEEWQSLPKYSRNYSVDELMRYRRDRTPDEAELLDEIITEIKAEACAGILATDSNLKISAMTSPFFRPSSQITGGVLPKSCSM